MIAVICDRMYRFKAFCLERGIKRYGINEYADKHGHKYLSINTYSKCVGRSFSGKIDLVDWGELNQSQLSEFDRIMERVNCKIREHKMSVGVRRSGKSLAQQYLMKEYCRQQGFRALIVTPNGNKEVMWKKVNYKGIELSVHGTYTKAEPRTYDYPGAPAEFEIKTIEFNGEDVTQLFENLDVDFCEIENQILIEMG